jgi:uncharacterized protein YukE
MTSPGKGINVDVSALRTYAKNLNFYQSEADNFGRLVDQADVSNTAWGVVGIWAKQSYTDKLNDLRSLLGEMKEGVDALTDKLIQTANTYQGVEDDAVIRFGAHEAHIDGPR